jgi:hypothetical protein
MENTNFNFLTRGLPTIQQKGSATMNKLLTLTLAVAMLTSLMGFAAAQTTDKPTTSSSTSNRGKPTKEQMTGKVIEVNKQAKTFTVTAKGKAVVLSGANLARLPKVGEVVDITYTETPGGGPLNSINLNSSRSNIY